MKLLVAPLALMLLASCNRDPDPQISVADAWTRATVTPSQPAAVYLKISNTGAGHDRLESVSSESGAKASVHESSLADGITRMRALNEGVAIAPNSIVEFKPNGHHIMLEGLPTALSAGTNIAINLRFERAGDVKAQVRVVDGPAAHGAHGHGS
ncbi:MAG: copper chaperone PCu(A)C [Sphingomicrobium sp.]